MDVRVIITSTVREKKIPDWENARQLNSKSSNNTSPTNLWSNAFECDYERDIA